jgi:hypothetical protein
MVGNPEPREGERWAYRARQIDDVVEVEVLKLGTQRPARVLVRFADDRFEGRQEWVSPARLKVLWAVDSFREREARWDRIFDLGVGFDDPGDGAANPVFDALIDRDIARMEYREAGACRVSDSDRLAELTGLNPELWAECAESFTEGEDLIVPWPVTEKIATAVARRNPTPLLDAVQKEENEARYQAIHGDRYAGRGGNPDHVIPADICIQVDNEHGRPRRAILRDWCGADAVDRYDELAELRREIRRVGKIAETAIAALRKTGDKRQAEHLARELGTPVEMLRQTSS